jgi:hypothetical protein
VHDTAAMRGLQRLGDAQRDPKRFLHGQRPRLQPLRQRRPRHELEHEEGEPVRFLEAVDRRDRRVVQAGE